jgi:hypothetical protein
LQSAWKTLYPARKKAKQQPHRDIAGCSMPGPSVFISYSHKDETWKDRLVTHLGVLQREGLLLVVTDSVDGLKWG